MVEEHREQDLRWNSHEREHGYLDKRLDSVIEDGRRDLDRVVEDINKTESALDKRLEGMNEFRSQLESQAATFLTNAAFQHAHQELIDKTDTAMDTMNEKFETVIKSVLNRHDADYNSIRDQLQSEREIRKTFEGSVSTWKWIASFLGVSGIGGVILLFVTRSTT